MRRRVMLIDINDQHQRTNTVYAWIRHATPPFAIFADAYFSLVDAAAAADITPAAAARYAPLLQVFFHASALSYAFDAAVSLRHALIFCYAAVTP